MSKAATSTGQESRGSPGSSITLPAESTPADPCATWRTHVHMTAHYATHCCPLLYKQSRLDAGSLKAEQRRACKLSTSWRQSTARKQCRWFTGSPQAGAQPVQHPPESLQAHPQKAAPGVPWQLLQMLMSSHANVQVNQHMLPFRSLKNTADPEPGPGLHQWSPHHPLTQLPCAPRARSPPLQQAAAPLPGP